MLRLRILCVLIAVASLPAAAQKLSISPFAGAFGGAGARDGAGLEAKFNGPSQIAVDGDGNFFVADAKNHIIRKVTSSGWVTTVAGLAGMSGAQDGVGSQARFNQPTGIAIDTAGSLFVADTGNNAIRKIDAAGSVTTVQAPMAILRPQAVARDLDGTMLVAADSSIYRVASNLSVTAVVQQAFTSLHGIAVAPNGTIYVADGGDRSILKIANGGITRIAGLSGAQGFTDGKGTAARFYEPGGIAIEANGNLVVGDALGLRRVTPDGTVTTLPMTSTEVGAGVGPAVNTPRGIVVRSDESFVIADPYRSRLLTLSTTGVLSTFAGNLLGMNNVDGDLQSARFVQPRGMAVDGAGNLWVADQRAQTLRKITPDGQVTTVAGTPGIAGGWDGVSTDSLLDQPVGIVFDTSGNALIACRGAIRKLASNGTLSTWVGNSYDLRVADGPASTARFKQIDDIAFDAQGNLLVVEGDAAVVRRITPDGTVTTVAGIAGVHGDLDGARNVAQFDYPSSIAVDSEGVIYVSEPSLRVIRRIDSAGNVSVWAGKAHQPVAKDGPLSTALLVMPGRIRFDADGALLVADGEILRKITADGVVSTVAGSDTTQQNSEGDGAEARFYWINSLAVHDGRVFLGTTNGAIAEARLVIGAAISPRAVTTSIGAVVRFSASAGGASTWAWSVVSRPADSTASIVDEGSGAATFTPDRQGRYVIRVHAEGGGGSNYTNAELFASTTCDVPSVSITGSSGFRVCTGLTSNPATIRISDAAGEAVQWGWRSSHADAITPIADATAAQYVVRGDDFGGPGTKLLVATATRCERGFESNEIPVTVLQSPPAQFTIDPVVYLGATYVAQGPSVAGATYQWYFGSGTVIVSGAGTNSPVYKPTSTGRIWVSLIVSSGECWSSHGIDIEAFDPSTSTMLTSSTNPSLVGGPVTFTANVATTTPGSLTGTITWKVDDAVQATTPLVDGRSSWSTSSLPAGVRRVVAEFTAPAPWKSSASRALSQTVQLPAFGSPGDVSAKATSATRILISWGAVSEAVQYLVFRRGSPEPVGAVSGGVTQFADSVSPDGAYAYHVVAVNASGEMSPDSAEDPATTFIFADDPIVPGSTNVRAIHVSQLRAAIEALRLVAGLGPHSYSSAPAGGTIRSQPVVELRSAINQARAALSLPAFAFSDEIQPGALIRAVHFQQLRDALK